MDDDIMMQNHHGVIGFLVPRKRQRTCVILTYERKHNYIFTCIKRNMKANAIYGWRGERKTLKKAMTQA